MIVCIYTYILFRSLLADETEEQRWQAEPSAAQAVASRLLGGRPGARTEKNPASLRIQNPLTNLSLLLGSYSKSFKPFPD